jgi:hypothetical protein
MIGISQYSALDRIVELCSEGKFIFNILLIGKIIITALKIQSTMLLREIYRSKISNIYATSQCIGNGTAHIRHWCWKIAVLSCHRCLINSGVEKMNNI